MIVSTYRKLWSAEPVAFPDFSGSRIMMMPVKIGSNAGVPEIYAPLVDALYSMAERRHEGEIGYLTIDEREIAPGHTLRRPGLHVDGYYQGRAGAWGGGGPWGSVGNGMLTVSSTPHCRAYLGLFDGAPDDEGGCSHIDLSDAVGEVFEPGQVYWLDGACIHESLPVSEATRRQFVRLSLPSNGPWFEGYTANPAGILPAAQTLPARTEFMVQ